MATALDLVSRVWQLTTGTAGTALGTALPEQHSMLMSQGYASHVPEAVQPAGC